MSTYIQIAFLILGTILLCRSLSLGFMRYELLSYRDSECIPRIVYQQKACDGLIIAYYVVTAMIGTWLISYGLYPIFHDNNVIPVTIGVKLPICLILMVFVYCLTRVIFNEAYDLPDYYKDMIHYRKAQEVVTEDNDHEVNFIRTYEKVVNNDKWMLFWLLFIVAIMIFV